MANPVLNERSLNKANQWAPPSPMDARYPPVQGQPVDDGPRAPWTANAMTMGGTISATAVLFVLMLATSVIGWMMTDPISYDAQGNAQIGVPMLAWAGLIVGLGLTFLLMFKPKLAKFVAPVYALAEGVFIGSISKMYETYYDGIVLQAAGATVAVFAVMLTLYATRIIRVTQRMRSIIMTATIGIMVFYGISFVISLFGANISFLNSPSLLGIGFSVLVAGLAAFNLLLDFDFIERGVEQRLDKNFEWFAAFGLLVTIIWLYLEILRLLAKLRER